MKKLLSILLILSFLFSQEVIEPVLLDDIGHECEPCPEPCDGHCLSDEVVQTLYVSIQELEHKDSTNTKIIENLDSQIYMYIQSDSLYKSQIKDYKNQLIWKEEMIDLVKPKWYDNKYLWFFGGMIITSGAVYLAGQID